MAELENARETPAAQGMRQDHQFRRASRRRSAPERVEIAFYSAERMPVGGSAAGAIGEEQAFEPQQAINKSRGLVVVGSGVEREEAGEVARGFECVQPPTKAQAQAQIVKKTPARR